MGFEKGDFYIYDNWISRCFGFFWMFWLSLINFCMMKMVGLIVFICWYILFLFSFYRVKGDEYYLLVFWDML